MTAGTQDKAGPAAWTELPIRKNPSAEQVEASAGRAAMSPAVISSAVPPKPTHFLCIPLVTSHSRPQLVSSIASLKRRIELSHPRVPAAAVRPVGSLHLTLDVMHLPTPYDVQRAVEALRDLNIGQALEVTPATREPIGPLTVDLRSLKAMRNPTKTSVLYLIPRDPFGRLQSLAQYALDAFTSAGLCHPARPLRLHATVYNTRYIAPRRDGREARSPQVDARALISEYKEHVWAQKVRLERIAICQMGAEKVRDEAERVIDEVYREIASIRLP